MSEDHRKQRLQVFVDWVDTHITGDEKGQAQVFLDRLFQGFSQKGAIEVGGTLEHRVKKAGSDGGGTSFADYVWKPVVLIEMKKRGTDLAKHYRQAFDYWTRLVPDRPRYVVLCNFDDFWIYDFDRQIDDPVDKVSLADLPDRWGPLAFLYPTKEAPRFTNDRETVTRAAADNLAACFTLLTDERRPLGLVDQDTARRFILQTLVSLFAEDIDLLPKYLFARLLDDIKSPKDSYDLIGGLFEAMNRRDPNPGGRFKDVPFFNGGLFAIPARIELSEAELARLKLAADSNWAQVSPEIFGTLFEHSLGKAARHAYGAHFTSPIDIQKIVGPTIVEPWTAAIAAAKTGKDLLKLQEQLTGLRVLDPACGSGNFLYVAYREMKRLEAMLRDRLRLEFKGTHPTFAHVSARQFFGLDINPFAIELAKVTMVIGRKLAIDELSINDEDPLPLDNLNVNFNCVDALMTDGRRTQWPAADVIIGNPPFLGAKRLKPERGADYVNAMRALYPDVPGMADYCVYWIRRAHEHLPTCTKANPFAGRAGLVGTQNIRNNQSRVGGLDHVVETGTIVDAVENQPWSGEANVHVSIANWMKTQEPSLVPKDKRLWTRVEVPPGGKRAIRRGQRSDKAFELEAHQCRELSSALSSKTDTGSASQLACNTNPKMVFQGVTPGHAGFILSKGERASLIASDTESEGVVYPYLIGRELLTGDGVPERWLIDFQQRSIIEAKSFDGAFDWIERRVLPSRIAAAGKGTDASGHVRPHHKQFLERWWKLAWDRADMIKVLERLDGRYIVCSRVTKRPIFVFVASTVRPGDALQTFMFDDDYSFGVLQSAVHFLWFVTKCSKLTERLRYTTDSVFDTFPWPQSPSKMAIDAIAVAGREVRRVRMEALRSTKGGLRAVYRTLELPGKHPLKDAHAALDAAVVAAYGFSTEKELLEQLLALNASVAARIKKGNSVTAPGVPPSYGDRAALISDDCVRP